MKKSETDTVFPDFFIGGAQKCGTSSLAVWLNEHPSLICSVPKEPNFFSNKALSELKKDYSDYFTTEKSKDLSFFEATTSTMVDGVAITRIKEALGTNVKFIFIMKDPVHRSISAYYHTLKHYAEKRDIYEVFGNIPVNLEEALNYENENIKKAQEDKTIDITHYRNKYDNGIWAYRYLYNSLYSKHIALFQEVFGKKNVLALRLGNIIKNPEKELNKICDFLKIPHFSEIPDTTRADNKTKVPSYLLFSAIRKSNSVLSLFRFIHYFIGRGPVARCFMSTPPPFPDDLQRNMEALLKNEIEFLLEI